MKTTLELQSYLAVWSLNSRYGLSVTFMWLLLILSQLVHMSPEEREAYCKEKKTQSMLPKIITTGYERDLVPIITSLATISFT